MSEQQQKIISFCLILFLCKESFCLPVQNNGEVPQNLVTISRRSFRGFLPKMLQIGRQKRDESSSPLGEMGDLLTTAIKDGIDTSGAFTSPTMFIGGFSVMMQPMPNGTHFAGQLMNMLPHYSNLLPTLPQFPGRNEVKDDESE